MAHFRSEIFKLTIIQFNRPKGPGDRLVYWPGYADLPLNPGEVYRGDGHDWWFERPPSRDDAVRVLKSAPWSHDLGVLFDTEYRESTQWPIVDSAHKAADAKLVNGKGEWIGDIRVRRDYLYPADSYDRSIAFVTYDAIRDATKTRDAVGTEMLVGNAVAEAVVDAHRATIKEGRSLSKSDVASIIRSVYRAAGLYGGKQPTVPYAYPKRVQKVKDNAD